MVCALDCNFSLQNELNYLEFASQNNFYGVFLLSLLHEGDADYYKKLASFSCPIVMVNRQYSSPDFDAVCVDYYQAGSIACGHLIDHGHRRIAFLSGPKELASTRNKVWGAADALAAHGIDFDSKNIEYTVHADYHDGYVCGEKLAQNKEEFSAVFCTNSPLACGLADALKSFNVKVPDDISIICTDNSPMRQGSPDITTVANDESDIANAAGQMLLDRILNPLLPKRRVVFPPTKISGGSVSQL